MSYSRGYRVPYYGGAGLSSLVPNPYPVSLNGRPYLVDLELTAFGLSKFTEQTVPLLRQQADNSNVPSEASINPEDLWRRSMESWHHGAGQSGFDRPDSDPYRFRSSKGVDVWTKWAMSPLPDTVQKRASMTAFFVLAAGGAVYINEGPNLRYTADILAATPTWTAIAGMPGPDITSIASNGYNVWAAVGASGLFVTSALGAATQLVTTALAVSSIVGYVKGRLLVSKDNVLYNVVSNAPAALPTALLTHPNVGFVWVGFAEGKNCIYAAGYAGDQSLIYRTDVKADGTALDVPVVAGSLPAGEVVRSIQGYLNYLLIGTDKGVRLAQATNDAGDLVLGALIPTPYPVVCFEPQGKFVWFGWSLYDGTSTGLGRMDLETIGAPGLAPLTPAYASDLMVTSRGPVVSITSFQNQLVFTVNGAGVYTESTSKVATATLDSGFVTYGLADPKIALAVDVKHAASLAGTYKVYLSTDGGAFGLIGFQTSDLPDSVFPAGQVSGETFEARVELDRSATDTTTGPTLTRLTLFAEPSPARSRIITVPLLLNETDLLGDGQTRNRDVAADLEDIQSAVISRQLVAFQTGSRSLAVLVKDYEFYRRLPTADGSAWQGRCDVVLKVPARS